MYWLIAALAIIVGLMSAGLIWGVIRIRRNGALAIERSHHVELEDIELLANECVQIFESKLESFLDLQSWQSSAQTIDRAFKDKRALKGAFEKDGFYWYAVLPLGAFLGELLRMHANHTWEKAASEAPSMVVHTSVGDSWIYPFEKIVKHLAVVDQGDIEAFVAAAVAISKAAPASSPSPPSSAGS
jgi:hypothetical protein